MSTLWCTALRAALAGFDELGLDSDKILRGAGIPREATLDPDARIPLPQAGRIWPEAQKQWQKPGLGLHTGAHVPFGELGAMDYLLVTRRTLAEGLAAFCDAFALVTEGATAMSFEGDGVTYGGMFPPHVRDHGIAALARRVKMFGVRSVSVDLAGPALDEPSAYEEIFGCPVGFEAPRSEMRFDARALQASPQAGPFKGLETIVGREVERLLATLGALRIDERAGRPRSRGVRRRRWHRQLRRGSTGLLSLDVQPHGQRLRLSAPVLRVANRTRRLGRVRRLPRRAERLPPRHLSVASASSPSP